MDKKEELLAEANCEICKRREADKSINIGLELGYTLGKYGDTPIKIYHRVKPECIGTCSLYLCADCEEKIKEGKYIYINVLSELKELIKTDLRKQEIKQEIIEALE